MKSIKTLIFDLDGVITSEKKYWNTSRLTAWELICDRNYLGLTNYFGSSPDVSTRLEKIGDNIIPKSFIYELKSRAINSNWDLTFFVCCLHFAGIFATIAREQPTSLANILQDNDLTLEKQLQSIGELLHSRNYQSQISDDAISQFWAETKSLTGAAVLNYVNTFIAEKLGQHFAFFDPKGELWQLCYDNFQAWYEGKKGYDLPDDETVIDLASIDKTLKALSDSGNFTLAIATGRPRNEVIQPLTNLGILQYFAPTRIVTYDEVIAAESALVADNQTKLGKPHPFILYKALYPQESVVNLASDEFKISNPKTIAYIGDAGSDVVAAKKAGVVSVGVLTGFAEGEAIRKKRVMLGNLGCDVILDSVLDLPELLSLKIDDK
ncbi:putative phosphatase [Xenococcus sp. PCC 7305]|uniref:HAD family hydrolase n=1 Tax=Xenococcus sp. PCC 7305 TaxID=102125 RepID=UPI0002ACA429|nr:HAD hydrolase-like protein [Xenococcus sp. PCC 7305]ELS00350.1 putative phosphatase [Xenococcus sp. PCC 7305]